MQKVDERLLGVKNVILRLEKVKPKTTKPKLNWALLFNANMKESYFFNLKIIPLSGESVKFNEFALP